MAKRINVNFCGMTGIGRTKTEAKQDAMAQLSAVTEGDWTPEIFNHRGVAVLIYRDLSGWNSAIVRDECNFRGGPIHGGGSLSTDRSKIKREALANLAQLTWQAPDGATPPEFLTDRGSIADFRDWARFQLRCQTARARGMAEKDIHAYASCDPTRPELWAHEAA
jgi:hypothetical protein